MDTFQESGRDSYRVNTWMGMPRLGNNLLKAEVSLCDKFLHTEGAERGNILDLIHYMRAGPRIEERKREGRVREYRSTDMSMVIMRFQL